MFRGVGTHGAKPHLGRDPITAAGHFLAALQTIPGRVVDPLQPAVVSACSLSAGDPNALNVIPDFAAIGGTARAYTPQVRDQLEAEIGRVAQGIAMALGVEVDYEFIRRIPPVVNDVATTALAQEAAREVTGAPVVTDFPPSTAGDDFAFFGQEAPGAYVWLGNGPGWTARCTTTLGTTFNDEAIATGVAFWASVARKALSV